ncbi:MAG: hypothetical protein ACRD4O_09285 [Bryobacteraceae bacterium]
MQRLFWRVYFGLFFASGCLAQAAGTAQALTWQGIEILVEANNPALAAQTTDMPRGAACVAANQLNLAAGREVIQ